MTTSIGGKGVGDGSPCYIIAEAGANHDRDFDKARRLIDVAANAGADAVKFQTYSGTTLYSQRTPRFDYLGQLGQKPIHQLLDDIAMPRDWLPELANHSREQGVEFLSTPFDLAAIQELDAISVAAFKVASFEIADTELLTAIAQRQRPMVLSTGMATLAEIDEALALIAAEGSGQVCLLQCASVYPAPPRTINLRTIPAMKAAFGVPVGLSDHTLGIHICSAAIAIGANLIEKHFTLDRRSVGPDHSFAIEPTELAQLVRDVREVEEALGDGLKRGPTDDEMREMYQKARRSVIAAVRIPAGTRIDRGMLLTKRPGFGIPPKYIDLVTGRIAARDIEEDEVITWDML